MAPTRFHICIPIVIVLGELLVIGPPWVFATPVAPVVRKSMYVELETIDLTPPGAKDPMNLFHVWRDEAKKFKEKNALPDAMTNSTIKQWNTVLLGGLDDTGFKIYTDYKSPIIRDIERNPNVSLVFVGFFRKADGAVGNRQVRIEGVGAKLPVEESRQYFDSTIRRYEPLVARLQTMIQSQSARVVDNRRSLVSRAQELIQQYEAFKLEMPLTWGGYKIVPKAMEFYQGTRDALNDRIRFSKDFNKGNLPPKVYPGENGWFYEQLEPCLFEVNPD